MDKVIWRQMWRGHVAEEVIRFGQEVASDHVVAVISHIGMFTALAQAAVDRGTDLRHWKESQAVCKCRSELDEFREPCLDVPLL